MKTLLMTSAAAAMLAVVSLPVTAGGPLAVCESGVAYGWANGGTDIPFNPDQGDLGTLSNADATALVAQAFQVWQDVTTSVATYQNAGQLPVDIDQTNYGPILSGAAPNGLSEIVYDADGAIFTELFGPGSGILGFAGPDFGDPSTCEITEGLAFLNGPAFVNPTAAFDVIVHEFGHYSNLAHVDVNGEILLAGDTSGPAPFNTFGTPDPFSNIVETMYPFYFGPGIGTGSLHMDDMTSLSTLYPSADFASTTSAVSGTVFNSSGTEKLTGVNVIARNVLDPFNDAISAISSDFTDSTAQSDPVVGTYTIEGLTPGADYVLFVDSIVAGGFSTPPLSPLPGPEEFYNGADESNNISSPDDPADFSVLNLSAGEVLSGVDFIFNAPAPGDALAVGLDGNVQLALPFAFEMCGQEFLSVFVNANGNLTFGSGDSDFTESAADMTNDVRPRIAALWDDFDSRATGKVFYDIDGNTFTVTWEDVPEFFGTALSTFSITLKKGSSHIDVDYGDIGANDGLAGISCGGGVTGGVFATLDLSEQGKKRINVKNQTALFEIFNTDNPVDLANSTVRYNGTTTFNDNWAEDNDSIATARNIKLPFSSQPRQKYTEIEPTGNDIDYFAFDAVADTTLLINIASGNLDSYLGLFDANGNLVAVDDDGGPGLLSQINYPVMESGTYYVAVTTFPDSGFTGAGASGGRYVLTIDSFDGLILTLGDDNSAEVALPFSFPFQGSNWSSVFVNSNGNLTFGSGDTDFSESVAELLAELPRIAPLWDDLSPNAGGRVVVTDDASSWSVAFIGVPEFFSSNSNSFVVTLNASGAIDISWGDVAAQDGLVGVSEGGGAADPGATDLSSGSPLSAVGTTYELFNFGAPFDLSNSALAFDP